MHQTSAIDFTDKARGYGELAAALAALLQGETDPVANAANTAALLYWSLPDLNWAGFYFTEPASGDLLLGPFQGRPACVRIPVGRGVCGTAAARRETVVVPDVHAFPGHIACDAASCAEIVLPVVAGTRLVGVLDLDSPRPGRFDEADAAGLGEILRIFLAATRLD